MAGQAVVQDVGPVEGVGGAGVVDYDFGHGAG